MGRTQPLGWLFFLILKDLVRVGFRWTGQYAELSPHGFTPLSSSIHGHDFIDYVTWITFMSTMKHNVTIPVP